jgi:hypothetical protein
MQSSVESIALTDQFLELVNEVSPGQALKYNKHYIGLSRSGIVSNFVLFIPKRKHVVVAFKIPRSDELSARLEGSALDVLNYDKQFGQYRVRVDKTRLADEREILRDLTAIAAGVPTSDPLD